MGKVRGKVTTSGDNGMLSYTDASGAKVDLKYDQPYSVELGIATKAKVSFTIVTTSEGDQMAIAVTPVCKGDIVTMDIVAGTGTLIETESKVTYPFRQNYLKDSGFALGQTVTYTLVNVKGILNATALEALPA